MNNVAKFANLGLLAAAAVCSLTFGGCGAHGDEGVALNESLSNKTNTPTGSPQLVFQNGFEGSTRIEKQSNGVHWRLRGNDGAQAGYPSDWQADLEQKTPYFPDGTLLNAEQGNDAQRNVTIVADPAPEPGRAGNKVLRMSIAQKHIVLSDGTMKARLQHEVANRNAPPAGGYIKDYYQKVKLYFSPSFSVLEAAPTDDIGWIVMQEFWNDPQWDAPNGNGTFKKRHEARTGIEIMKKNGALFFGAKGRDPVMEVPKPSNNSWLVTREDFHLPIGKWMTQEIYVKEGNSKTGRFYMSVTVDGKKTVLIDKTGMTTSEEPGSVPDGQTAWSPMKIYTEGKVIDWFEKQNKTMDVYWDDLEIWLNRTPETSLTSTPDRAASPGVRVVGLGGLCLDSEGKVDATGAQMVVASCDGSPSQEFDVSAAGELRPRSSASRCVDDLHSGTEDGTKIQLWPCNGTGAQKWTLTPAGELQGPGGKCIEVEGARSDQGTKVELFQCKGNDAQKWTFSP